MKDPDLWSAERAAAASPLARSIGWWKGDFAVKTAPSCSRCGVDFYTADIVVQFGEERTKHLRPVRHLCARCGFAAIRGGQRPSRAIVFVRADHAEQRFEDLDERLRDQIEGALARVDELAGLHGLPRPVDLSAQGSDPV